MTGETNGGFESGLATMFPPGIARGDGLFFVQGFWRSGTSWIGRMLGSHPRAYVCHHELQSFMRELNVLQFGRPMHEHAFLESRLSATRKAGFLSLLLHFRSREKPDAALIGERSPGADVVLLKQNFPAAKMIIVLRDGRDICVSAAFLASKSGMAEGCFDREQPTHLAMPYLERMARLYAAHVAAYICVRDAYPADVLLVRYEDVLSNPAREMRAMFDFLQLEVDDQTLAAICGSHTFAIETGRTAGDEDRRSFARKGVVGDWRHRFTPQGLRLYESIAGSALQQAAYHVVATGSVDA